MVEKLIKHLHEECHDVLTYCQMAEDAEMKEDWYLKKNLKAIAWDEYTHARAICDYLTRMDIEFDEETKRLYREAKQAIHNL